MRFSVQNFCWHTTPGAFFAADLVFALHYCQASFLFGWILWVDLWKLSSIITCLWVNYKPPGHRTSLQMWFNKGNHPKMGLYECWWISVAFPDTVNICKLYLSLSFTSFEAIWRASCGRPTNQSSCVERSPRHALRLVKRWAFPKRFKRHGLLIPKRFYHQQFPSREKSSHPKVWPLGDFNRCSGWLDRNQRTLPQQVSGLSWWKVPHGRSKDDVFLKFSWR